MQTDPPKITVLMPVYNAGKYIYDAINSVLSQTFTDFELLIINDGSTDDTEKIMESFNDPRISIVKQSNKGIAIALNTGLQLARTPYIARFDADDICYNDRLEIQYRFMTKNPGHIIAGSAVDYTDMDGNYIFTYLPPASTNEAIQKLNYANCPFIHSSVIYKKEIIVACGGYNMNAHNFEDHFLWRKAMEKGKVCNLPQPLMKVRINPQSVTIDERWRGKKFLAIKYRALKNSSITDSEGKELLEVLKHQDTRKIKEGSYYALLAKKFLWNNHQPQRARENLRKVLSINYLDWQSHFLLLVSYLPYPIILKLYRMSNLFK